MSVVTWVLRAIGVTEVPPVNLANPVSRAHQEMMVNAARKENPANLDQQAERDQWAHLVIWVSRVTQGRRADGVCLDHRDQRANEDLTATQDLKVNLGRRVLLAVRVSASREPKVHPVLMVSREKLETLVRWDQADFLENRAILVNLVALVSRDQWDLRENKVTPDRVEARVSLDHLASLVTKDLEDLLVRLVKSVIQVLVSDNLRRVIVEKRVTKVPLESLDVLVSVASPENAAHPVLMENQVRRANEDREVHRVRLALAAPWENQAMLAPLDLKVRRGNPAQLEHLALWVPRVSVARPVSQAHRANQVRT